MYTLSQGHEHLGPGTSMVQRINWTTGMERQAEGLGCASCGGNCGRCGLGLFESGMDISGWTWQEWLVVGLGGYVLTSMFFTTRRAARQVSEGVRKRVRRTRRRIGGRIAGTDLE